MANDIRVRANAIGGLIEDNPLASGGVTLNSAGLSALPVIGSTQHAALTLDPNGRAGEPEIVWVTSHAAAATSATIVRGREGTTARQHAQGVGWRHTLTAWDFQPMIEKAGTISDADFPHAPPNGSQGLDSTNNRWYVRIGGVWKYTALT